MGLLFTLANQLSILLTGRRPQWTVQVDTGGYPNGIPAVAAAIGVNIVDSPKTQIAIKVREFTHARSVRLTLPIFDLASTYAVDLDTTGTIATAAVTDLPTTLTAIAAAITADVAGLGAIVTATANDSSGDGVVDNVLLTGKAEADYVVNDVSVAGGTGTIVATVDRNSTDFRVFSLGKDPNGPGVYLLLNGGTYRAEIRGYQDRFDSAGVSRLYVELFNLVKTPADAAGAAGSIVDRAPDILMGPSVQE